MTAFTNQKDYDKILKKLDDAVLKGTEIAGSGHRQEEVMITLTILNEGPLLERLRKRVPGQPQPPGLEDGIEEESLQGWPMPEPRHPRSHTLPGCWVMSDSGKGRYTYRKLGRKRWFYIYTGIGRRRLRKLRRRLG